MKELKCYKLKDGETHYYVARSEGEVRRLHFNFLGDEEDQGDAWIVEAVPLGATVSVSYEDASDSEPWPEGAMVQATGRWTTVAAPAAAWCKLLGKPGQICSTCY